MVRQNPRQLVTLLNWTRRWSEWKRKISRRVSIVFLLSCVWLLERNGMNSILRGWREEWNCLERKQCECDYQFFIWFWSVWNGKRIGSGIMWVWMLNPCIPHWKSYNKEGRKEGWKDVLVRNYPSRCKNPETHWELIQWSGCWFARWNRNCWIGWKWLVVCLDFGDSTGSREWSHPIGWMVGKWNDDGKGWIWMSEEIGFGVAWFRCNFHR